MKNRHRRRFAASRRNAFLRTRHLQVEPLEPRLMLATHGGEITADETWSAAEVHELTSRVTVEDGITLTIEPGAIVQSRGGWADVVVQGTLLAAGSATDPILFTVVRDDTGFDGILGTADDLDTGGDGPTQSGPGAWSHIWFDTTSTGSTMDHTEVRYGGYGSSAAAVVINGAELTLTNSVLRDSVDDGLRIQQSNPVVTGNVFRNNGDAAISMDLASNPAITGVTVENNHINALQVDDGAINVDTHWNDPEIVYWLQGNVTVDEGAVLTVGAGQVVKFGSHAGTIWVNGTLIADGTAGQPIIFTDDHDDTAGNDTNNNGNATGPAPGGWCVIYFSASSMDNLMDHVEVRWGGYGSGWDAEVVATNTELTLTNSVLEHSQDHGLRLAGCDPVLTDNTYRHNADAAISMNLASNPAITGVTLENNRINGLEVDAGTITSDAYWDDPEIVYWLQGNVTVDEGAVLTVGAGQVVKFGSHAGTIWVKGTLIADGTAGQPIVFTDDCDDTAGGDTNNNGDATDPFRGGWCAIHFSASSTGNLMDHVEVRWGAYGGWDAQVVADRTELTLTNSVLEHSQNHGLQLAGCDPVLTNNTYRHNADAAIGMDLASNPAITGVTLENNRINGLEVDRGTITSDAYWDDPEIVYWVKEDVTVDEGAVLTVGAGQVVKFGAHAGRIWLNGTLVADGAAGQPIIFTDDRDDTAGEDTNNDDAASSPARGGWCGIWLNGSSAVNVMDYVEVRWGGYGTGWDAQVVATNTELTLTNSMLEYSQEDGLRFTGSDPVLTNNTYRNNADAAISMDLASNPEIIGVTAENNRINGLQVDKGTIAVDGFWDDPDIVYWLDDDTVVANGATLTVAPGQVVKAGSHHLDIRVDGTLRAEGAPSRPIVFTDDHDDAAGGDTNNNGEASGPAPDGWSGIWFSDSSADNVMDHVEVRWGGYKAPANVWVGSSDLTMTNSTVRGSSASGLNAGANAEVELVNNLVVSNSGAGIRAAAGATVTAVNNTVDGNYRGAEADGAATRLTLTNNLITNNTRGGMLAANAGVIAAAFNDVFNPGASEGNYKGLPDQTDTNGNISAEPLYVDRDSLDYQLQDSSPAIDAATSVGAPANDFAFNWRHDHPDVADTGAGEPSYYDMGALEYGGLPRAVKHRPDGPVAGTVGAVQFTFRDKMDTGSFVLADDIVSFAGPDGSLSATGAKWLNPYQLEVSFDPQAKVGDYQMVLGTGILDANDKAIDQDGDGAHGETPDDQYAATWSILPPRIVGHSPDDFIGGPILSVSFEFDRPMDQDSFSIADDVASFTGPDGDIVPTGFDWTDPQTLEVSFDPQTALGLYEMILGPDIRDAGGNRIDQDDDRIYGEAPGDQYTGTFTLADVMYASGTIQEDTTWGGLVIVDGDVSVKSGVTLTVNPGTIVKFDDLKKLRVKAGGNLEAGGTTALPIRFTSIRDDTVGGDANDDGDRTLPNAGDWKGVFADGGTVNLNHSVLTYGAGTHSGNWDSWAGNAVAQNGGTVTLSNSTIRDAFFEGVITWGTGEATITNSVIAGCDRGINVDGTVRLTNSTIDDNRIGLWGHGGSLEMVNTIVSNSFEEGVYNILSTATDIRHSNVWSTTGTNYRNIGDQTGANGNISVDPEYRDTTRGIYQLDYASPMIDAADGTASPDMDHTGAPRYDDPRTENTGIPTAGGAYADMGAFEFVEGAQSEIDLIVTAVGGPAAATAGDTITVQWSTRSVGTEVATGSWHDAVYLSADTVWTTDDLLLGEFLHSGDLGPNQSYDGATEVTLPGVLPGDYYFLVRTNSDNAVFEGRNLANNTTASAATIATDLPTLTIGTPLVDQLPGTGKQKVYKLAVPEDSFVRVDLDGLDGVVNELYLKRGDVPTRQSFDARGVSPGQADQFVSVSSPGGGDYYVMVHGAVVPAGQTFTLTASLPGFSVDSVTPDQGSNTGQVTISIVGARFEANSQPRLVDSVGIPLDPIAAYFIDSGHLFATFDLTGMPTGLADVQVVNSGNVISALDDAFEIVTGEPGRLAVNLVVPDRVRVGRDFPIYLEYANEGNSDLLAPVLELTTSQGLATLRSCSGCSFEEDPIQLLVAVNSEPPVGILPPGATNRIALYGRANALGDEEIAFRVGQTTDTPIDYDALDPLVRPHDMSDAEWNSLYPQIQAQIGANWSDYAERVATDASLLPPELGQNHVLRDVLRLVVDRANAALHTSVSGTLFLEDNSHPLGDARIRLFDPDTENVVQTASLNDGSFLFPDVSSGTYEVTVAGFVLTGEIEAQVGTTDITDLELVVTPAASISGAVILSAGGAPVDDAIVTATSEYGEGFSAETGHDGTFHIDSLPAGDYVLRTGGDDYVRTEISIRSLSQGEHLQHVAFALEPGARIQGTVSGPAGVIEDAIVSAVADDGRAWSAETRENGDYEITGLPGQEYAVLALTDGLVATELTGVNVAGGTTLSDVDLVMTQGVTLSGTITATTDGTPAASVAVTLGNPADGYFAVTDEGGDYEILNCPPGSFTVTATDSQVMTTSVQTVLTAGLTTDLNLQVPPRGEVMGTVTNGPATPLPGVIVFASDVDGSILAETVTDENGEYSLGGLDAGDYSIVLGDPGSPGIRRSSVTLTPADPAASLNFIVDVAGFVSGTVFSSDGTTPVTTASVALSKDGDTISSHGVDEVGDYSIVVVKPGTYQLEVSWDAAVFPPQTVVVGGGSTAAGVDFTAGDSSVSGVVRHADTGLPMEGAYVPAYALDQGLAVSFAGRSVTLSDGSFRLGGLIDGSYQVYVVAAGYALSGQRVDVAGADVGAIDFAMAAENTVTGTVTDQQAGSFLAEATVDLIGHAGENMTFSAITDDTGQYLVAGLAPDSYDVVIMAPGYQAMVSTVVVGSGAHTVDAALPQSTVVVQGQVVGTSEPLPETLVVALDVGGNLIGADTTDANGLYAIDTLPPGNFSVVVLADGYGTSAPSPINVAAGQNLSGVNFQLDPVALSDPQPAGGWAATLGNFATTVKIIWQGPYHHKGEPGPEDLQGKLDDGYCLEESREASRLVREVPKRYKDWEEAHSELKWGVAREAASIGLQVLDVGAKAYTAWRSVVLQVAKFAGPSVEPIKSAVLSLIEGVGDLIGLERDLEHVLKGNTFNPKDAFSKSVSLLGKATGMKIGLENARIEAAFYKNKLQGQSSFQSAPPPDPVSRAQRIKSRNLLMKVTKFITAIDAAVKAYETFLDSIEAFKSLTGAIDRVLHARHAYIMTMARANAAIALLEQCKEYVASDPELFPPLGGGEGRGVQIGGSHDPNDKIGPASFGAEGFMQPAVMPFEIQFENDPDLGATLPAQEVFVTDTLDEDLDLTTLEFTSFGFNDFEFGVPPGLSHYETTIDLRPEGIELLVPVVLDVDPNTRELSATFRSLDPLTGLLPDDIDAGFLPVNDKQLHNGEGYFTYVVRPITGLPSGTEIRNQAEIVFDVNEPILTPETLHTIDVGGPSSSVDQLVEASPSTFTVNWTGTDDEGGSGIGTYDVYVSDNGEPFEIWLPDTPLTSVQYQGEVDHTYRFYSVATDNVGYREAEPLQHDAETTVVGWHNSVDPCNVNGEGGVTPLDVLTIIHYINSHPGDNSLPAAPFAPPPYYDVNNDQTISPLDVLTVITFINSQTSGEAETVDTRVAQLTFVSWAEERDRSDSNKVPIGSSQPVELVPIFHDPVPILHDEPSSQVGRPAYTTDRQASPLGLLPLAELDTQLAKLEEVLPDIANEIAGAWRSHHG